MGILSYDIQNIQHWVKDINQIVDVVEQLKEYWDETGLNLYLGVTKDGRIAFSTKHWFRINYFFTDQPANLLWNNIMIKLAEQIGRTLIRSENGEYVYIHKLSFKQTQEVFDKLKKLLVDKNYLTKVETHFELDWDINEDNVVLPPVLPARELRPYESIKNKDL